MLTSELRLPGTNRMGDRWIMIARLRDRADVLLAGIAISDAQAAGDYQRRRSIAMQDRAQGIPRVRNSRNAGRWRGSRARLRQSTASPAVAAAPRLLAGPPRADRAGISVGQYAMAAIGLAVLSAVAILRLHADRHRPEPAGWAADRVRHFRTTSSAAWASAGSPAFIALFPEAIDLMVRALRVGSAGHRGDHRCRPRNRRSGRRRVPPRRGRHADGARSRKPALGHRAQRIDAPEFRFFIIALSVQRETGGNLAETLANLSDVLRRRRQMRAKARAMASETRATTMILGGLPVLVIVMLTLTSPAYLAPLYQRRPRAVSWTASRWQCSCTGVVIMTKMAKFEI